MASNENTKAKLEPISEEQFDGEKYSADVTPKKCSHEFYLIGTQEMRCKKCSFGLTGDVLPLYKEYLKSSK